MAPSLPNQLWPCLREGPPYYQYTHKRNVGKTLALPSHTSVIQVVTMTSHM